MAGLADLVHSMVGLAKGITSTLQATIQHEPYKSQDVNGDPTYGSRTERQAIVTHREVKVTDNTGVERISRTQVMLLENVAVDTRDRITLPDGTKPSIVTLKNGVVDGGGQPYAVEIYF
jgi:hypothetical protein